MSHEEPFQRGDRLVKGIAQSRPLQGSRRAQPPREPRGSKTGGRVRRGRRSYTSPCPLLSRTGTRSDPTWGSAARGLEPTRCATYMRKPVKPDATPEQVRLRRRNAGLLEYRVIRRGAGVAVLARSRQPATASRAPDCRLHGNQHSAQRHLDLCNQAIAIARPAAGRPSSRLPRCMESRSRATTGGSRVTRKLAGAQAFAC